MNKPDKIDLILAPRLTPQTAAALWEVLAGYRGQSINVDASAVLHIGASGFEVLLCAIRAWKAEAVEITFDRPSKAFLENLERIGLAPEDFELSEG